MIEFENSLQERIQELNSKLKDCDNLRESDILINEIDTLMAQRHERWNSQMLTMTSSKQIV
jgi:hypothetical protein